MTESSHEVERRRTVRQLWLGLYKQDQRTGHYVLAFHLWLEQNRADLLNRKHGDSYQHLKSDLDGLWRV